MSTLSQFERVQLSSYNVILINSSGGKDSQAMIDYVTSLAEAENVRDRIVVVHANLGKVEWAGTMELARRQAQAYGHRFIEVSRPQGDLLQHVRERGMWPSPTNRYCTSDHKRDQVSKVITMLDRKLKEGYRGRKTRFLNCMGLRAQESPARAKKVPLEVNKRITTKSRHVDTWLPILSWDESKVWDTIRKSGVEHAKAYDLGMPRLSCVFCIFAPKAALVLAGRNNPELLDEYVEVERQIDHKFRMDISLAELKELVDSGEDAGTMNGKWNM